jgi:tetratricopeptide (TPR) repeat protein
MRARGGVGARQAVLGSLFASGLTFTLVLWPVLRARANDFEDFEAARSAYEAQDYARSAKLFEALAGGDTPALTNRSLVLESKKYLGASYLFMKKLKAAEQEFERLLRMDPQYMLDPLGFPEEVQRLFARVKTRLDAEFKVSESERRREEERLRVSQSERESQLRARWARLSELAQTETVHQSRSRWLALMPFGIGQFQNGHLSLGAVLAVSEGSLLAVAMVSWVVHENLRGVNPVSTKRDEFNLTERVSRYTNQISMALFGVLAITGVIDAQLRFRSSQEYERKRPLPADLYGGPEVSVGLGGATLRLRF